MATGSVPSCCSMAARMTLLRRRFFRSHIVFIVVLRVCAGGASVSTKRRHDRGRPVRAGAAGSAHVARPILEHPA